MKKFLVFLVLAIFITNFSFGGSRETQVANSIEKAKYANWLLSGIDNPDKIKPGQIVWIPIPAKEGDNEWWIFDRVLPWNEVTPDTTVYYNDDQNSVADPENEASKKSNFWNTLLLGLPLFIWLIIAAIVFAIIMQIRADKKRGQEREWSQDPVTAGTAQVPGGIDDESAYSRMNQLAHTNFPSARIEIKNIRRGTLSGPGEIFYAEGNPKKINLKNVPAYAGEILVNSKEQTIYFLQGCGNDARQGNFMSGEELIFTPDVIINEDGSESQLPQEQGKDSVSTEQTQAAKKSLEEKAEATEIEKGKSVEITGSDLLKIATGHQSVVDEFLKGQNAHKVTMKVTTPNGAIVETILETKNEPKKNEK